MLMRLFAIILFVPLLAIGGNQMDDAMHYLKRLQAEFNYNPQEPVVLISIKHQKLVVMQQAKVVATYPISSSAKGVGSEAGSDKTPLGIHRVAQKFGAGAPAGTIFKGRVNTGRRAEIITEAKSINTDDVTTRILWLDGMEHGLNKGGNVDSKSRYIYIHGTPEEGLIGTPASHGCIRMKNDDVAALYELIDEGCFVVIMDDTK